MSALTHAGVDTRVHGLAHTAFGDIHLLEDALSISGLTLSFHAAIIKSVSVRCLIQSHREASASCFVSIHPRDQLMAIAHLSIARSLCVFKFDNCPPHWKSVQPTATLIKL